MSGEFSKSDASWFLWVKRLGVGVTTSVILAVT